MKSNVCYFVLIGLSVLCLSGCKPNAREVSGELSKIPVGIPRSKVYEEILRVYSGQLSKPSLRVIEMQSQSSPQLVTRQLLEVTGKLIQSQRQQNEFIIVSPKNLFQNCAPAYFDAVGLAAESAHGIGGVSLYYDLATNYVGFMAASIEKVGSK